MKRTIKTIATVATVGIMLVCAYLSGTTQAKTVTEIQEVERTVEVVPDGYLDTNSEEFQENYVDMRKVVYWEAVDGLQLYYEDGSGYYWEQERGLFRMLTLKYDRIDFFNKRIYTEDSKTNYNRDDLKRAFLYFGKTNNATVQIEETVIFWGCLTEY